MAEKGSAGIGRQAELLVFIVWFIQREGYPPTVREMAEGVGLCPSYVHHLLRGLEGMGRVRRTGRSARALTVLPVSLVEE